MENTARIYLDVPYADLSAAQKLDLYLPVVGEGPFPVIVFIHGGAFSMGDKADCQIEPWLCMADAGYALASVNYRLSCEAKFPVGLQDIKAAIRFLRANAAKYCIDSGRMAVSGDSAGGYYAAMVCLTADCPELDDPAIGYGDFPCGVSAGVDWFGPTDFLKMDEQLSEAGLRPGLHGDAGSPESLLLGAKLADAPDLVRRANPITYVHRGMPPMLIQHGSMDDIVPCGQSVLLAMEIERISGPGACELDILEDAGHGDKAFETPQNMKRVLAFLGRHLGR